MEQPAAAPSEGPARAAGGGAPDAGRSGSDARPGLAIPPQPKEANLWRLILGAGVFALLLVVGLLQAAAHGWLPEQLIATIEGSQGIPDTTNPETMALGAIPVSEVTCGLASRPPGGVCVLQFLDERGDLVWPSLDVPVPATWLRAQTGVGAANQAALLYALVQSPYSPPNDPELDGLPISVDPSLGSVLAQAGVTPTAFLAWLYRNVPDQHRPPWVPGGVNPANNPDY